MEFSFFYDSYGLPFEIKIEIESMNEACQKDVW
jgi:hypothetical protein